MTTFKEYAENYYEQVIGRIKEEYGEDWILFLDDEDIMTENEIRMSYYSDMDDEENLVLMMMGLDPID